MSQYYKIMDGEYITAIGVNCGGEKISQDEFKKIETIIQNKYTEKTTGWFRLRKDLTWEEIKPPELEKEDDR